MNTPTHNGDWTYLAQKHLKKMVVSQWQWSHHSVFQRNYLQKNVYRKTIYSPEGHSIAPFQHSADMISVKIHSTCYITPPQKTSFNKKYLCVFIITDCNFLPKLKCAAALLLYSVAFSSSSLLFTMIPSV